MATKDFFPGASLKLRTNALWQQMQTYYAEQATNDRLQDLTALMIRKQGAKTPKLRASAAEARALVGFGYQLAVSMEAASPEDLERHAARVAAKHLEDCYDCLTTGNTDFLRDSSTKFGLQVADLHNFDDTNWACKPKMHLVVELCGQGIEPTLTWLYREEDFGGTMAHLARRRGGVMKPGPTSAGALTRFTIKQGVPRLLSAV